MKRILIAEDEEFIRENLGALLRDNQFEVELAGNGNDALDCIQSNEFDLICLDIRMPGLTGMDLVRKVRETSDLPIVVITGNPDDIDPEVEAKVDGYIHKPYKDDDVMLIVRDLTDSTT